MPSESFPLSGFYSLVYLESETTISKQDFPETTFFFAFFMDFTFQRQGLVEKAGGAS